MLITQPQHHLIVHRLLHWGKKVHLLQTVYAYFMERGVNKGIYTRNMNNYARECIFTY